MAHILLVDDDDLLREALHKTLARAGYEVEEARNGALAIQAYQRRPSDLVITDIIMPDHEGLETIQELRRLNADVKIIAMSGGGLGVAADYLAMARMFGATRVLAKPFTGAAILSVVAELLAGPAARGGV